jgi:hypothetical protein
VQLFDDEVVDRGKFAVNNLADLLHGYGNTYGGFGWHRMSEAASCQGFCNSPFWGCCYIF